MRVLVIEGNPGVATSAVDTLNAAGHETTSCHHDGSTFPCNGLGEGRRCPLEDGAPIDVALLVRDVPGPDPTIGEDGVRCALRRHVPLAVAGAIEDNPYERFTAASSTDVGEVVSLAEQAVARPLAAHAGVARAALETMLRGEGLDPTGAEAIVTRHGNSLSVLLVPGVVLDPMLVEVASVRALAAVRSLDRSATIIDVSVAAEPGLATI